MKRDVDVDSYITDVVLLLDSEKRVTKSRRANQVASVLVDEIAGYAGLDRKVIVEKVKEKQKK